MNPKATMVLADHVQESEGKLYVNGGGWTMCSGPISPPMGIGLILTVPFDQTNRKLPIQVVLVDADGGIVEDGAGQPLQVTGTVEVGRPPGLTAGQDQNSVLAINVAPQQLEPGQFYRWEARLDGEVVDYVTFQVRGDQ